MKILMLSEYFPPEGRGGGEISAFLLAKELSEKIDVHVLTSHFPGLEKEEKIGKIIVHRLLKTGRNPGSVLGNLKRVLFFEKSLLKQLERLDREENFDIIHCMNANSSIAIELRKKLGKPFVLHVNSPVLFCPKGTLMYKDKEVCDRKCSRLVFMDCYMNSTNMGKMNLGFFSKLNPALMYTIRKRFEKYQKLMGHFDFYMPISSYMRERLLMAGIPKDKIKVIYNITEFDKFLKLKLPKNKIPRILYLGEYSKPKGAHVLMDALEGLEGPYECNYYGDGILKKELVERSRDEKLNVNIHERVPYEEIPEIMQMHDILIYPSLVGEAFGRSVIEACAAGKLVIASDIGGIPDIIDSRTGYLFRPGDSDALRALLKSTIRGELYIDKKKVRQEIRKRFSAKNIKEEVLSCYKDLK